MKKYICLTLIVFLLVGCTIKKVEEDSFDSIINTVLYNDISLNNVSFEGFKFYLPRGVVVDSKNEYNLEIKDQNNKYFLYVDIVAYYYNTKVEHDVDINIFYSKNLNYKNNEGYIDVSIVDDKYFLEVMYNYAKIEAYVESEYLYDTFLNICYILSTIDFNDSTINYKLSNQEFETTLEEFDIFTSKKDKDNFLEYIEEFDKYESSNTTKDEDIIETDDN